MKIGNHHWMAVTRNAFVPANDQMRRAKPCAIVKAWGTGFDAWVYQTHGSGNPGVCIGNFPTKAKAAKALGY